MYQQAIMEARREWYRGKSSLSLIFKLAKKFGKSENEVAIDLFSMSAATYEEAVVQATKQWTRGEKKADELIGEISREYGVQEQIVSTDFYDAMGEYEE